MNKSINAPTNTIVCDKNPLIRSGITQLFTSSAQYRVIATATDGERLFEALRLTHANIVIMGWEMPYMNGEEVLKKIQQQNIPVKIVIYSARNVAYTAMKLGAAGYLSKRDDPQKLLNILPLIEQDQLVFPYNSISQMNQLAEQFSARETQILEMLSDGDSNQKIASQLCLSINTIKFHLKNIYAKLGVKNRIAASNRFKDIFIH